MDYFVFYPELETIAIMKCKVKDQCNHLPFYNWSLDMTTQEIMNRTKAHIFVTH